MHVSVLQAFNFNSLIIYKSMLINFIYVVFFNYGILF